MNSIVRAGIFVFVCTIAAAAAPIVTIFTAVAPNASGSPSYAQWQANAAQAIVMGLTSGGTFGQPTFFQETSSFVAADEDVTNLPSWLGVSNPAPPFNNELGNRITFITVVHDSGGPVNIATGLNFLFTVPVGSDYDTGGGIALSASRNTYSAFTIGVTVNGSNTITNTQTSGTGSANFILAFIGFGLEPFETPENQTAINDNLAAIRANPADASITGCSTFGAGNGCGASVTANIADVGIPEPGSVTLLVVGLGALAMLRRKLA